MSSIRKDLEFWFDAQGLGFLSGFNARRTYSTARMGSYFRRSAWLSVLRQPAPRSAAPKCHMPSALWAAYPAAVSSTPRGAEVPFAIGLFGATTSVLFHQAEASGTLIANIKGSVYAALLFTEPRPVCRVLHALSFAPQPNCQVNSDAGYLGS
jgi:hypothetical protein